MKKRIGFISFRIAGTDGVSLETKKWAHVLEKMGHECYYMAGELDTPGDCSYLLPEAHFTHPEIRRMYEQWFQGGGRPKELSSDTHKMREIIKEHLYQFQKKYNLDIICPQNAVTIPLNLPLAMAITEFIAEQQIPTIAHHHDFFWERKRFLTNSVWDYINMAFPPHLANVEHVVINSSAKNQLALRTGISSTLIPNVMDFDTPPKGIDEYTKNARKDLGIPDDAFMVLQPTRVVQRKGIEHAIEFVSRIGDQNACLVISHASGDEGYEYEQRVMEYADLLKIKSYFVSEHISEHRATTKDGRKMYTLDDIYPHADFITYPSLMEGFGNAFLEAIYFKRPILVNNYSIYSYDIKPKGFDVIEMDDFISADTINRTKEVINNPDRINKMVDTNFRLGRQYYSFSILEEKLHHIMIKLFGKP